MSEQPNGRPNPIRRPMSKTRSNGTDQPNLEATRVLPEVKPTLHIQNGDQLDQAKPNPVIPNQESRSAQKSATPPTKPAPHQPGAPNQEPHSAQKSATPPTKPAPHQPPSAVVTASATNPNMRLQTDRITKTRPTAQPEPTTTPAKPVPASPPRPVADKADTVKPQPVNESSSKHVPSAPVVPELAEQPNHRPRKARLRLARIDPWSVMKTTFLFAIAFGIMIFVGVWVIWGVVEASGLFGSINKVLNEVLGTPGKSATFKLENYVSSGLVLGYTALLSVLNIVITTALATLFAFLYNLAAAVLGGLEITLAED